MTWTRHENGAGETPTFGRRRQRADQLWSVAAASAKCRRRRRTALPQPTTLSVRENNFINYINLYITFTSYLLRSVIFRLPQCTEYEQIICKVYPILFCQYLFQMLTKLYYNILQKSSTVPKTSTVKLRYSTPGIRYNVLIMHCNYIINRCDGLHMQFIDAIQIV